MFRSLDFFTDLPFEPEKKLDHLYELLNFGEAADMSYELAEKVTMGVMRLKGNSDDLFLHWLHFMGYYIKVKHGGKWYLARSFFPKSIARYHPSIINGEGQIWEVGDFCWQTYYVKGKLGGIGFPLFYKLNIEQLFGPHMAANWNKSAFQPLE